jgi:PAS domain S-box-containing protein
VLRLDPLEQERDAATEREHTARLEAEAQVQALTLAREALAEQQAQLRLITDAVPALIALVGKDLVYRFANEAYRTWFARPPETVVGHTLLEVMGPFGYANVREHVERALGGADVQYEAMMPYPTGTRRVRTQLIPLRTRSGAVDGFVALVQDISSERRREEKLQLLAEASAALTSSLDFEETLRRLASLAVPRLADWCGIEILQGEERSAQLAVAHVDPAKVSGAWALRERYPVDWSQRFGLPEVPLTSLKLTLSALDQEAGRVGLPEAFRARLDRIQIQGTRLAGLVDQLLDVSRISAGKLVIDLEAVDLGELAGEVVQRFAEEARRVGTTVTLRAPAPVPAIADRQRMDQVLTNLISNALKYGASTPIEVQVDCSDGPRIRVQDVGPGIPPEEHERIFERFERGGLTHGPPGMGLGLWIVREIVQAHHGRVWAQSPPGGGTTFEVVLPPRG